MGKVIVYGDIHGCFEEFYKLREKIGAKEDDIEISVGDFLNKGPYSIKTLRFIKDNGILAVRGNHEDKFIRYHTHQISNRKNPMKLTDSEQKIFDSLLEDDIEFLKSLPFYIKFNRLTVVHAGVTNSIDLKNASKKEFAKVMRIRFVDEYGRFVSLNDIDSRACCYWSEVYDGHEGFIVYGHNPFFKPRIDRFSIGIDTGVVYGNRLSAAVFDKNGDDIVIESFKIESIDAKKMYKKREFLWMI